MTSPGDGIHEPRIRVLLVASNQEEAETLCRFLRAWDFEPVQAESAEAAATEARQRGVAIAIVAVEGGDRRYFELVRAMREASGVETILLGRDGSAEFVTEAFRAGAYDCLMQPTDFRQLGRDLNTLRESFRRQLERSVWFAEWGAESVVEGMVGISAPMRALFAAMRRLARESAPVLITGLTGSGKERVAQALHSLGKPSDSPLVIYRCCGVAEEMAACELLGHRGDWGPSAAQAEGSESVGVFESARGGTLVLDEIGELPLPLQEELERLLEREAAETVPRPVRVVATSRFSLFEAVHQARFSPALYRRLSENIIHLPSLAERMEDLPLLSRHFLQQFNQEFGGQVRGFSSAAEWALLNYRWPGNVRELENVIGRACLLADGPHIEVQDLSIAYTNSGSWSEHLGGGAARPDRSPTSAVGKKAVRSAIIQK